MGAWPSVRFRENVEALIADLTSRGVLTDRVWRAGLQEVARHQFVPTEAWAAPMDAAASPGPIHRRRAQADWWRAVYSNTSIVTQRDDGGTAATDPSGTPTCSLSCPVVAIQYLQLLDLADHHRVLEIGTGTGWTAAMLAWRLGGENVTTVEVDKQLVETAEENFNRAGRWPQVVTGDGAEGHAGAAPYDRVHVTCGVHTVPPAWLEQTRPGGVIVAPYMPIGGGYGHQLRLDVISREHAVGRFLGDGGFMMLRDQRRGVAAAVKNGVESATAIDPRLIAEASGGAQLAIAALAPGLAVSSLSTDTTDGRVYEATLTAPGASAVVTAMEGADEYHVVQSGDRRLWYEAVDAYLWWIGQGRPGRERFGLAVDLDQQSIWIDRPSNVLR